MLKNKNNIVFLCQKTAFHCLVLLGIGAFNSAYAADYTYSGSGGPYNLNPGDTLTISSGTFSQNISLPSGATIDVKNGASFMPSSLNNGSGSLVVNPGGAARLPGVAFNNGLVIDNSGDFTFASNVNMNGRVIITNRGEVAGFAVPTMTFLSGYQLSSNSEIDNQSIMNFSQDFNTEDGTTLTNSGTISMVNFNPNGNFVNNGFIRTTGHININSNSNVVNNCSFVAEDGFNNNSNKTINNGIILTTSTNSDIKINNALHQSAGGYMQGAGNGGGYGFVNNSSISGSGNYYFSGDTRNQGTFGFDMNADPINFYDATPSGNKFFDSQNILPLNTTKNSITPMTQTEALSRCTYGSGDDPKLDFGDAPVSYGEASHTITSDVHIGNQAPDAETAGQSDSEALGDDNNGAAPDDENSVVFPTVKQGEVFALNILVSGAGGYLQAWIDWNGDGDFTDADEQVVSNLQDNGTLADTTANDGIINVSISTPANAIADETYARFRWSTSTGLGAQGTAADGEVEDYSLSIEPAESGYACSVDDIEGRQYSSASPAANSLTLSDKTYVYEASFDSSDWSGQILAYNLNTTSSKGGTKAVVWDSASTINSTNRSLFTYNPDVESSYGRALNWDNLTATQRSAIAGSDGAAMGQARVDWLYGGEDGTTLRERSHLLGDIIHSSLTLKDPLTSYGYQALPSSEGTSYAAFLASKTSASASLFAGSNSGMLHALDAETGSELFAYIPNEILGKIPTVSHENYGCSGDDTDYCLKHEYLVDGVSTLGDAYLSNNWRSVLVGTLGLGGRGLYALNVTNPQTFSEADVLWEISATQAPDSESVFASHLGYTLPSASVVRAKNGQWLAITGNGYDSQSNQAVLFIIDLETGELVKAINTMSGSGDTPNGLSTPTVVDSDGDTIADRIYAGDLLGNLWVFDISSSNSDNWQTAYGNNASPEPLFRACTDASCSAYQPITAAPQVGKSKAGGLMVYIGTGKYTDIADGLTDNTEAAFDSFYGLQDNGSIIERSQLVAQEILAELAVNSDLKSRVTSDNLVDYANKKGWFLNLVTPPGSEREGERVVSQALLRGGRIIFTTLTPSAQSCASSGSSWLMEMNAQDGSRLSVITFDTNDDLSFTTLDNATYQDDSTVVSGLQKESLGMISSSPVIIKHTTRSEGKYVSGSETGVGMFRESASDFSGRMSWSNISH